MKATSVKEDWDLDFAHIAKIWRAGCIIRAVFLQDITSAYQTNSKLENLLFADCFVDEVHNRSFGWRASVANSALTGVPMPAINSALSYFDSLRCEVLPANLLQAQRDYFGAHSYSRVDEEESNKYHLTWSAETRNQVSV